MNPVFVVQGRVLASLRNSDGVLCGGSPVQITEKPVGGSESHADHRMGQTDSQRHAVPPPEEDCTQGPQVSQVSVCCLLQLFYNLASRAF